MKAKGFEPEGCGTRQRGFTAVRYGDQPAISVVQREYELTAL